MKRIAAFGIFFLLMFSVEALSQPVNLRCKKIKFSPFSFCPDTLSLVPGSVYSPSDTNLTFNYNLTTNRLLIAGQPKTDSMVICYRVFPYLLNRPVFKRNPNFYDAQSYYLDGPNGLQFPATEKREQLLAIPGLNKSGSLSRGVSFGNRQNVFVNSALNLQLDGKLTDNLRLTAVISDQNVPFQPQGNTQNIREFDKVFIQLENPLGKLIAGDVVLQNRESAFLRYYKNVQGGNISTSYGPDSLHKASSSAAIAIAKGKFYSYAVQPQEGVQGPYRLQGPTDEILLIILANSEKVYLDGRLLKRGFGQDYTIDYNQGQITFNNTILITKYSRIRVDFEYSERNYTRSIVAASHYQRYNNWDFSFNYYREADDPNKPLSFSPDSADARRLSSIGDSTQLAIVSGATRTTEFSQDQILYTRKDTLGDSIFVYCPVQSPVMYSVIFSEVGQGKGDYALQLTAANGRIYKWVGKGAGNFSPFQQIVTPKLKSMTTFGLGFRPAQNQKLNAELAINNNNINRYASGNGTTDKAVHVGYSLENHKLTEQYKLNMSSEYEMLGAKFDSIDRFRPVDFNRDWNASPGDALRASDNIFNARAIISSDSGNRITYKISRRLKGNNVDGWQHSTEASQKMGYLKLDGNAFYMKNNRPDYKAEWLRYQANLLFTKWKWIPGYTYTTDENAVRNQLTNKIIRTAMNYSEHKFLLKTADTTKRSLAAWYGLRTDKDTLAGELVPSTLARTANLNGKIKTLKNNNLSVNATWRQLQSSRSLNPAQPEQTIMGRLDWNSIYLNRCIKTDLTFTSGTGRELKREYRFVKISALGEGTHQWIDYNHDGIQQLDEFVEAARPEDRQYIKIFVPTSTYVNAYSNALSYRLNLIAPTEWNRQGVFRKVLAKLSNISSFTTDRKLTGNNLLQRFNPFQTIADNDLVSTSQAIRSTLFFNRSNPRYGADLALNQSRQKQLLNQGFDSRRVEEWKLNTRNNLGNSFNLQITVLKANRISASDYLLNRNYQIKHLELGPELIWQTSGSLRLTGQFAWAEKNNLVGEEKLLANRFMAEARWNKVSERTVSLNIRLTRIGFNGNTASPVAYEMLEALLPGNNLTCTLNLQQKLGNGLQMTLNYEGRKSEGASIIHLGKMQVTALF